MAKVSDPDVLLVIDAARALVARMDDVTSPPVQGTRVRTALKHLRATLAALDGQKPGP